MSNYTLLIAWSIAGCSLAGVLLMYWRYRRMVRHYNKYIMKYIREHDLLAKELEHALIEKSTMEKLLKTYFSEATDSPDAVKSTATDSARCENSPSPGKYSETEDEQNTRPH